MVLTKLNNKIVNDFLSYMKGCGGPFSSWYVGVSKDARNRLFNEHKVKQYSDNWIYRTAISSREAREIESYFINELGTDGGTGGGDHTAKMVYAYKKGPHTEP